MAELSGNNQSYSKPKRASSRCSGAGIVVTTIDKNKSNNVHANNNNNINTNFVVVVGGFTDRYCPSSIIIIDDTMDKNIDETNVGETSAKVIKTIQDPSTNMSSATGSTSSVSTVTFSSTMTPVQALRSVIPLNPQRIIKPPIKESIVVGASVTNANID